MQYIPQKEVARRFRVTEQLVSTLVCEARTKPEKLRKKMEADQLDHRKQVAIQETVSTMLKAGTVITSSKLVCQQVKALHDLEVSERSSQQVMKGICRLSFVKAKKLSPGTNTQKSQVLR